MILSFVKAPHIQNVVAENSKIITHLLLPHLMENFLHQSYF